MSSTRTATLVPEPQSLRRAHDPAAPIDPAPAPPAPGYAKKRHHHSVSATTQSHNDRLLWSQSTASSSRHQASSSISIPLNLPSSPLFSPDADLAKTPATKTTPQLLSSSVSSSSSSSFSLNDDASSTASSLPTAAWSPKFSTPHGLGLVNLPDSPPQHTLPPSPTILVVPVSLAPPMVPAVPISPNPESDPTAPSSSNWGLEIAKQLDQIKVSYADDDEPTPASPESKHIDIDNDENLDTSSFDSVIVLDQLNPLTTPPPAKQTDTPPPHKPKPAAALAPVLVATQQPKANRTRSESLSSMSSFASDSSFDEPRILIAPTSSSFFDSPSLSRSSSTSTTSWRNSVIRSKHTSTASTISTLRHFLMIPIEPNNNNNNEAETTTPASPESPSENVANLNSKRHSYRALRKDATPDPEAASPPSHSPGIAMVPHPAPAAETTTSNQREKTPSHSSIISDAHASLEDFTPSRHSVLSPQDGAKVNNFSTSRNILSFKKDNLTYRRKVSKASISAPTGLVNCEAHFASKPAHDHPNSPSISVTQDSSSPTSQPQPRNVRHSVINSLSNNSFFKSFKKDTSNGSINSVASSGSSSSLAQQEYLTKQRKLSEGSTNSNNGPTRLSTYHLNGSATSINSTQSRMSSVTDLSGEYPDHNAIPSSTSYGSSLNKPQPLQQNSKRSFGDIRKSFLSNPPFFRTSNGNINEPTMTTSTSTQNLRSRKSFFGSFSFPNSGSDAPFNGYSMNGTPGINRSGSSNTISQSTEPTSHLFQQHHHSTFYKTMISLPVPLDASREKLKNKLRASSSLLSLTRSETPGSGSVTIAVPVDQHNLSQMEKLLGLTTSGVIEDFDKYIEMALETGGNITKLNEATFSEVFIQHPAFDLPKRRVSESPSSPVSMASSFSTRTATPSTVLGPASTSKVFKIIPFGNEELNQSPIQDVIQELRIARLVMHLEGFVDILDIAIARGNYPGVLLEEWDKFRMLRGTDNMRPDIYNDRQLYCVIVQRDAGTDLERVRVDSWVDAESVFWQTVAALAQAEEWYQFEHRDLHWGNLVVAKAYDEEDYDDDDVSGDFENLDLNLPTRPSAGSVRSAGSSPMGSPTAHHFDAYARAASPMTVSSAASARTATSAAARPVKYPPHVSDPATMARLKFIHQAQQQLLGAGALKVTLIDYTLSRAAVPDDDDATGHGGVVNTRMDQPEFFRGKGDYQYDIYRFMRDHISAYSGQARAQATGDAPEKRRLLRSATRQRNSSVSLHPESALGDSRSETAGAVAAVPTPSDSTSLRSRAKSKPIKFRTRSTSSSSHIMAGGSGGDVEWAAFCPQTNVFWLHYLVDKLLHQKGLRPVAVTARGRVVVRGEASDSVASSSASFVSASSGQTGASSTRASAHSSKLFGDSAPLQPAAHLAEEARACRALETAFRALAPTPAQIKAAGAPRKYANVGSAGVAGAAPGLGALLHGHDAGATAVNDGDGSSSGEFACAGDVLRWGFRARVFPGTAKK